MTDLKAIPISQLPLSVRAQRAMENNEVENVAQFLDLTLDQVLSYNIGRKTWLEIRDLQRKIRGETPLPEAPPRPQPPRLHLPSERDDLRAQIAMTAPVSETFALHVTGYNDGSYPMSREGIEAVMRAWVRLRFAYADALMAEIHPATDPVDIR